MSQDISPDTDLEVVVVPRTRDLGDHFEVRRALPSTERRMVGPFVFFDQMGPVTLAAGRGLDVRPHPHIGLATATYLFDGEILHRDSIGSVQAIRPGDVNWMTAGRGIVHSERTAPELRVAARSMSGLQCWVALPRTHEEIAPSFVHAGMASLPVEEGEGVSARIIAGSFFGHTSPVQTLSDLFYVDLKIDPGARIDVPALHEEQAIYIVSGRLNVGHDGVFDSGRLLVLRHGASVTLACEGTEPVRCMLLGGEPMDGTRYLSWNFVSSSLERIEQAREDWRMQKFDGVPGETEFIPLPAEIGRPIGYP